MSEKQKEPELNDRDLDKVQANFDGFSNEFVVLYKEFQEKIKHLSKKQAFRLLEAVVAFPLEHEKVSLSPGSKEIMELACQIHTTKSNMLLAYFMDTQKKEMEKLMEQSKNIVKEDENIQKEKENE